MEDFKKIIKKLDFLGEQIGFEHENNKKYKSFTGCALSFLTFVAIMVIALLFGKEIYERKNPNVSLSTESIRDEKILLIDQPLIVFLTDLYGRGIKNQSDYFDFEVENVKIDNSLKLVAYKNYSLVDCPKIKVRNNKEWFDSVMGNTVKTLFPKCINITDDDYIQNPFGLKNSSTIRIYISFCDINNKQRNCKATEEFKNQLFVIGISTADPIVDTKNYSSPIKSLGKTVFTQITRQIMKTLRISLSKNIFSSDNGWLLEEYVNTIFNNIEKATNDFRFNDNLNKQTIFQLNLDVSDLRFYYLRNYLKVQELFARIGGIANCLVILISTIFYHYFRFKYLFFIRDISFDVLNNNNESKILCNHNSLHKNHYNHDNKFPSENHKNQIEKSSEAVLHRLDPSYHTKNNNFIDHMTYNKSNSININDKYTTNNGVVEDQNQENHKVNNKKSIKKFNTLRDFEKGLFDNNNTFQKEEKIYYCEYFFSTLCPFLSITASKEKYIYEKKRIEKLLDIEMFKHFLIESYYKNYEK